MLRTNGTDYLNELEKKPRSDSLISESHNFKTSPHPMTLEGNENNPFNINSTTDDNGEMSINKTFNLEEYNKKRKRWLKQAALAGENLDKLKNVKEAQNNSTINIS